jgi:beta-phosphoglucomutase
MIDQAVLWDVDGTLIDSEEYHWLAWRETMIGEGYALTRDQFNATFGWRNDAILRKLFGSDLSAREADRIATEKEVRYRELVLRRGIELLPGVQHWLDRLKADRWQQAIASSAPRQNLDTILTSVQLENHFDAIVSAEDVTRGKPDPQVFLLAAERLAVPPRRCIVIEDSPAGIEGAQRAGMRSIGVGVKHASLPADRVVRSLAELPEDALGELLSGERGM